MHISPHTYHRTDGCTVQMLHPNTGAGIRSACTCDSTVNNLHIQTWFSPFIKPTHPRPEAAAPPPSLLNSVIHISLHLGMHARMQRDPWFVMQGISLIYPNLRTVSTVSRGYGKQLRLITQPRASSEPNPIDNGLSRAGKRNAGHHFVHARHRKPTQRIDEAACICMCVCMYVCIHAWMNE
jgi:hypothetical protein